MHKAIIKSFFLKEGKEVRWLNLNPGVTAANSFTSINFKKKMEESVLERARVYW